MPQKVLPIRVPDFEGGLNLQEKSIIPDNALSVATNVFYNADKKLQTRRGLTSFGQPIPDAVKVIHNCDTTAGNGTWAATDDATALAVDSSTQKRGAGALSFNITVATTGNDFATLTNSTLTAVDISTTKGYIGMWIKVPTGALTNFTDCKLRVGSDASNYYEFTISASQLTEGSFRFVPLLFSAATTTGTPVDTGIDYLLFRVNYTASYTNKTGFEIDDICAYSATSAKPTLSLKYFKASTVAATRYLTANCGTALYEYDETSTYWNVLKTGLTEDTRFDMTAYKNIMYFTNGVDNYFSYNGVATTEHTGANTYKGKYLLLANDVGYILGDPTVPSTVAYTGGTPADLNTFPNVLVLDEDDSSGKGTGLINLGPIVIGCKEGKIYKINVATPSREQLDYSDGALSDRDLTRVENEVFISNKAGTYTLAQREATTGSLRSDPLSEDIQALIDTVTFHANANSFYVSELNNLYRFIDTNGDGKPDTCIVFSILTKKWTKYVGLNANEVVLYQDSSGNDRLLFANAFGGQVKEFETGFNDNGNEISCEIQTKNFDFDVPEKLKTFEMVEVFGFISSLAEINFQAIVDDITTTSIKTILGSTYVTTATGASYTLGASALGTTALGGSGGTGELTLYPFKARIPMYVTGSRIRLRLFSNKANAAWILTKASIYPYQQALDVYPTNSIY